MAPPSPARLILNIAFFYFHGALLSKFVSVRLRGTFRIALHQGNNTGAFLMGIEIGQDLTECSQENLENLSQSLCTFKCRKVITCQCPCINVLSIGTSSYLNVETEQMTKWCSDGETEPT